MSNRNLSMNIVFPFATLANEEDIREDLSYAIMAYDRATNDIVEMFTRFGYTCAVEAAQDCYAFAQDFVQWLEADKKTERPHEPYAWHWLTQMVIAYTDAIMIAYRKTLEPDTSKMFHWLCASIEGRFDMHDPLFIPCKKGVAIICNGKAFEIWDAWCFYAKRYRQLNSL